MTGFGRGTARAEGLEATVELRSVNSRHCEVSARLPRAMAEREADVAAFLKDRFERGRLSVNVQVEQEATETVPLRVDAEAARGYARLLERLREAAGLDAPVRLEHLLTFSDVFTTEDEAPAAGEGAWAAVQAALTAAADALAAMRRREGDALENDLHLRLDAIERTLQDVETRAPLRVEEARQRLHARLEELFNDERLVADRLEAEIALLADRLDVTEECVRLHAHLAVFREALASDAAVGRKLNFLAQEMGREVNTIGSKSNDAAVAHLAVAMKEELEKIREQVQNVE